MTFSIIWTALPRGYADAGTLRLSLMASPRIADGRSSLADSPLRDWPAFVRALGDLAVQTKGGGALIPATKEGPVPDSELWRAMFSATTRVRSRGVQDAPPQITASTASFVRAHESLRELRRLAAQERALDAAGRIQTPRAPRTLSIVRAIAALDGAAASDPDAALALPFAGYARALRGRAKARAGARRPLAGVGPIHEADFHQMLGLLLTHPHIAKAVGLRIDLRIPAFSGPRSIRVVRANGQPLNGPVALAQSFSRVIADPQHRRFTMAAGPGPDPEVVDGMLAVAGDPDYVVATTDVIGQSLQLVAQSLALAANGSEVIDPGLPGRRDLGVTIARRDRPARVVTPSLQRSAALHQTLVGAHPGDQSLELFADDVTSGFRLDVSVDGGPFRSLMARRVQTTVGSRALPPVEDEGRFEAFTGVEQPDEQGIPQLTTGEEIASWDGWAVAVPRPGHKVETDPGAPVTAAPVPVATMPDYGVRSEITPVPGSLPRLRFGSTLQFRLRVADLAGNSIDPEVCDPAQVLQPVRYLRTEGAPAPTTVLRRRYTEGESLNHLVVRSTDGVPEGTPCERHLAPPNAPQALVERHGMFDAALGNNRGNQGVRDEMLALARREAGSFLDPIVPDRTGTPVPAPGIAVVTNDPQAPPPVNLPIPRGQALPNGAYVIHDADHPHLPYLADPIVAGVSLIGFPGAGGPVVAPLGGGDWPDVTPIRLVVRPTSRTRPQANAEVVDDGGRPALVIHVPPGFMGTMELASSIRGTLLGHIDTAGAVEKEVLAGLVPEVSPRQEIMIVHAVRVPSAPPAVIGAITPKTADDGVSYTATATVSTHAPTTAQVDIEATWTERSDPGTGELVEAARVLRVGSQTVERGGDGTVSVPISQLFGDGRHRRIALTPWATTRFREYYKPVPEGDRSLQRPAFAPTNISIPNRSRPVPPKVHSVLPLFEWKRGTDQTGRFGERITAGLRIWLERPWLQTGEGELLGVVVHTEPPAANAQQFGRLQTLVSRWGGDPLELRPDAAPTVLTPANFQGVKQPRNLKVDQAEATARILGFDVQFDADRGLWFADVRLTVADEPWPFVRLGLVRYQPESRSGMEISPVVVTDFAQLPPNRKASFTREGPFGIRAKVVGPKTENSAFRLRQERYMPDPFDASTGLASDAGVGPAEGWTVTEGPTGNQLRANMLLSFSGGNPGPVMAELEAGRVVVEEVQTGLALLANSTSERVVFTETVARNAI